MPKAYVGLGSNLGDKRMMLEEATARLGATPGIAIRRRSALYRTPPWGDTDQDSFLNGAIAVETALPPHALLDACLAVERSLGRVRGRKWGPRSIDLDLLHVDGVAIADARLVLPHPYLLERAFVLVPLVEIAPDLVIEGVVIGQALARLDQTGIERVPDGTLNPA